MFTSNSPFACHTASPSSDASPALPHSTSPASATPGIDPVGNHCILELNGCCPERLNDEAAIRRALGAASRKARSTLLSVSSHCFEPQGVTAVALLAESHISIHTWPESGYAAVDVFTCGEHTDPVAACRSLARWLGATDSTLREIRRGMRYDPHRTPAGADFASDPDDAIKADADPASTDDEPVESAIRAGRACVSAA